MRANPISKRLKKIKEFKSYITSILNRMALNMESIASQIDAQAKDLRSVKEKLREIEHFAHQNMTRQASYFGEHRACSWSLDNLFLIVNAPDLGFPANLLRDGAYEEDNFQITSLLWDAERPFLDIGANCGIYAARLGHLTRRLNTSIHAFEPNPEMHQLCAMNLFNNGLNHCHAINVAASNKNGQLTLCVDKHHSGGASLKTREEQQNQPNKAASDTYEVQTMPIDEYLYEHNIDAPSFAKIDVEGHEGNVLLGMKHTLEKMANSTKSFGLLFECLDGNPSNILESQLKFSINNNYDLFHVQGRCKIKKINLESIHEHPGYLLLLNNSLQQQMLTAGLPDPGQSIYKASKLTLPLSGFILKSQSSLCSDKNSNSYIKIEGLNNENPCLAIHGPYTSLRAGRYRLLIDHTSNQELDIKIQHSMKFPLKLKKLSSDSYEFELEYYTTEIEILIHAATDHDFNIYSIKVEDIS
jgi:FkbM family methyltransferase